MTLNMNDLRSHIGEIYEAECWKALTGVYWEDGTPWQLYMFEQDVKFDDDNWRCVIIERDVYDPDDLSALDYAEDVVFRAWKL